MSLDRINLHAIRIDYLIWPYDPNSRINIICLFHYFIPKKKIDLSPLFSCVFFKLIYGEFTGIWCAWWYHLNMESLSLCHLNSDQVGPWPIGFLYSLNSDKVGGDPYHMAVAVAAIRTYGHSSATTTEIVNRLLMHESNPRHLPQS